MIYVAWNIVGWSDAMANPNFGEREDTQVSAPEPLEFLVGSWNRFVVLDALTPGPRTRADLREETGVSRPTLSRILSDLIDREWVRRRNDEYEATRRGAVIVSEVTQLVDNIETAKQLDSALEWLRTDRLEFPLSHLKESEVLTPTRQNQTAPMRKIEERIDSTSEMRVLATGVTYEVVDAICQTCLAGELQFQCVLDESALRGTRAHPELAEMFVEMIEQGTCDAYYYDSDQELIAYNLIDGAVMFCGISGGGLPLGILVSEDETVRSWAAFNFEKRKGESKSIEAEEFAV